MAQLSQKVLKYLSRIDRQELEHIVEELDQDLTLKNQILNNTQEGILICQAQQKILYTNDPFLRLFQLKENQVIGKTIEAILEKLNLNNNDLIGTLFNDQQTVSFDFSPNQDNQSWIRFHANPIFENETKLFGVSFSFTNITDLKELDEKRAFTEKWNTLIPLAAGLAHEIGNPLNALDIHMQLALRESKNFPSSRKDKLEKYLHVAKEEIDRLNRIVSHFLGAVRPLKGNLNLADVNEVLDIALDLMTPEASQTKVTIERRFQTNLPELLADQDQLKQAFINLIKNALQAMPKGGLLQVQTERTQQHVQILFIDNGIGISKEETEHIFEPYYSNKEKGSGLGLVEVKRIINNHGGTVQVESKPKKGAIFTLLLPLNRASKPLLTKGKTVSKPTKKKKSSK